MWSVVNKGIVAESRVESTDVIYNGIKFEEQSKSLGTSLLSKRVQFNTHVTIRN